MNKAILILLVGVVGCGSPEDPLPLRAGRTVLAVGTFGISEVPFRNNEKQEFAKKTCIQAGLKEGTSDYSKCFLDMKRAQLSQPVFNNMTNVTNNR